MDKDCGVLKIIDVLGGKWTMAVIWELCTEPKGFNELQRQIDGVSPRVLSARLKELVAHGIVDKKVFPTNPPQVQYSLTEKGRTLKPIIGQLEEWGRQN